MSMPSMTIDPEVGVSTPRIMLIVVVLPAPFGPSSPTISLRATWNDTRSTATTFDPYTFRRLETCRTRAFTSGYSLRCSRTRVPFRVQGSDLVRAGAPVAWYVDAAEGTMKIRILGVLFLVCSALAPTPVRAQTALSGSIAGVVRDASGGVLPGVTVEASSPALIERTRTVTTDDNGAY